MSKNLRWLALALTIIVLMALLALWLFPNTLQLLRRDNTWHVMQTKGVWRVGLDPSFPPFETLNDAGQPEGFDVALAEQIAATWGLRVEVVPIGFDSLLDALQTGQIDSVISALPFDERMTRDVTYSAPYFESGIFLAARPETGIQGIESLADHTVGVEWGSMGDQIGRRLHTATPTLQLQPFDTPAETINALIEARGVDAILIDNVSLRMAQVNGADLVAVGPVLESNPFVIAMPNTAYELHAAVAERLTTLQATGVLAALEERWFGEGQS